VRKEFKDRTGGEYLLEPREPRELKVLQALVILDILEFKDIQAPLAILVRRDTQAQLE
jgi:hypothetical protein